MAGLGTGQPISFQCAECRRTTGPCRRNSHDFARCSHKQTRTGRTRPAQKSYSHRMLPEAHEYVCQCGHTGWSRHNGVLRVPSPTEPA